MTDKLHAAFEGRQTFTPTNPPTLDHDIQSMIAAYAIDPDAGRFPGLRKLVLAAIEYGRRSSAAEAVRLEREHVCRFAHRMDDEAQGITERRMYDLATELRILIGVDGEEAAIRARSEEPQ